jgi:hypothetical protein
MRICLPASRQGQPARKRESANERIVQPTRGRGRLVVGHHINRDVIRDNGTVKKSGPHLTSLTSVH